MGASYLFTEAQQEWSKVPVDEIGYFSVSELLNLPDDEFNGLVKQAYDNRYDTNGWRNFENKWVDYLKLDSTEGKTILDYGCGLGLEAIRLALAGNQVSLADINRDNTALALKSMRSYGATPYTTHVIAEDGSLLTPAPLLDIFYANGVLHHTPHIKKILQYAASLLNDDGQIRLMLYSDKGWQLATNTPPPPIDEDVTTNEHFMDFVRYFDEVGTYADWYSLDKLTSLVGEFLKVVDFGYITSTDMYCVAILKKL